ncbi:MAG TPA: exodeoxyribonuclease VII small subunit, partial [Rhodocyclaceae bacterium]|nr:exodeoxyribonuclease VII small subunit [Rhodocyclaceae bacterium]
NLTEGRCFGYFYALSQSPHLPMAMAKQAPSSSASPASAASPENFESALGELERIVQSMEQGEMPLEASLTAYQRGVALLKFCQDKLGAAEQTIRVLENGQLQAFAADTNADEDD